MTNDELVDQILTLKRKKNAVILVHNYQRPEVYDVADYIGDSLGLCREAQKSKADLIIFCGVHFMAESAVILNPGKKVVVPHLDAGCAMADMVSVGGLKALKDKHPDAAIVTYVNSTAEIKAISDVCVTSSNALDVVSAMPQKKIIFVPDKNLAAFVAKKLPHKEIIPWNGYCPMHQSVSRQYVDEIRLDFPNTKIIAHPESNPEVLEVADHITSTSGMIEVARKDPAKDFFVLTECGMTERLHREVPGKRFTGLCNLCFDMKKTTLRSILNCLENEVPVVTVDSEIARRAKMAFDKMFELTA